MARCCELCGQALPEKARRDPPLPPLEKPTLVTIHDLPPGVEAKIVCERGVYKLALPASEKRKAKS